MKFDIRNSRFRNGMAAVITVVCLATIGAYVWRDDLAYWRAEEANSADAYREYLKSYPSGKHAFEADWKIQRFEHPSGFSIGIYTGKTPFELGPGHVSNPVLAPGDVTDVRADLVADPFMIRHGSTWYMFFEVETPAERQGDIGYAESADGFDWKYGKIVLNEPFHLSYPYVFEYGNDYYMIPESNAVSAIRLYKAVDFPVEWAFEGVLLEGERFSDPSIFRHGGKWWIFAETSSRPHDNGTLRLYFCEELAGPWAEHPKSPVVKDDPNIARPAGRVIVNADGIFRFTQDCLPIYGYQVWVFRVTDLTPETYAEQLYRKDPVVTASGNGWNRLGMHHVDPHRLENGSWIACVDGLGDRN